MSKLLAGGPLYSNIKQYNDDIKSFSQGVCTEAGMYALRERRVHVTQEDFEMAVAKVGDMSLLKPIIQYHFPRITTAFTVYKHGRNRK